MWPNLAVEAPQNPQGEGGNSLSHARQGQGQGQKLGGQGVRGARG